MHFIAYVKEYDRGYNMNLLTQSTVHYGQKPAHQWERTNVPELTERLREARVAHGYNQGKLAEVLSAYMADHEPEGSKYRNITQAQISKWEKGETKSPGIPVLKAMCIVLNVTLDYLMGLVDDPHSNLVEEGLSDRELLLIRRVRQHPELLPLLYRMLNIEPPRTAEQLGS